jgi:hypothetical protein
MISSRRCNRSRTRLRNSAPATHFEHIGKAIASAGSENT